MAVRATDSLLSSPAIVSKSNNPLYKPSQLPSASPRSNTSRPTRHHGSNRPMSMKEHLAKQKLPFWVRLISGNSRRSSESLLMPAIRSNSSDIFSAPIQILEIRRRRFVTASKMQWERRVQDYVVTGADLPIPLHFRGWFEVIPDDGRPVEYFDSIQGITAIKPKKFLVRTSTVGYELGEEDGSVSWVPREIFPGEVLSTGMVYMDHRKTCLSTNMKNLFKRFLKYRTITTKKDQDLKYLQCFDGQGHEVMVPLIMTGVFSPIGDPNKRNYDAVYELKDLTRAFDLPVKAQLVHAEPNQKHYVPHGVLKLKTLDEDDCVVASKHLDRRETFELPLDEDLCYIRDITPKSPLVRKLSTRSLVLPNYAPKTLNGTPFFSNKTDQKPKVDLPVRVPTKDTKKPKAAGFIERLGARKTKKERAAIKALQEEGVFSSRLCKVEMPFDSFYSYTEEAYNRTNKTNGQESENKPESENNAANGSISSQSSTSTITSTSPPLCSPESSLIDPFESQYAKICKKPSMMKRDLPPVPLENKDDSETGTIVDEDGKLSMSSTDTLYEHLPEAPNPPPKSPSLVKPELVLNSKENEMSLVENEEDGYMVPSHLQRKKTQKCNLANPIVVSQSRDVFQPNFIPKFCKDTTTYANCGRPRNGYKSAFQHNPSFDRKLINETSASTSNLNQIPPHKPPPTTPCSRRNSAAAEHSSSRSRFQRHNNVQKISQCHQNPNLINCPHYSAELQRSSHTMDPNLTLRHHNMRRLKSAIEMFHYTDSFHEMRPTSFGSNCSPTEEYCPHDHYDVKGFQQPYDYFEVGNNPPNHNPYSESDPGNRYFVRSVSVTGLSDNCAKHGDDSAISLCSKGDYGYQAGSDFSYTDYTDVFNDDGWLPPDNIISLSVQDVSRSLRYIGMKDRVVKRFANEQIDGQMLASLDWKLLQDGFPELNTLEVKKIIDFVNGWRPKKSVS